MLPGHRDVLVGVGVPAAAGVWLLLRRLPRRPPPEADLGPDLLVGALAGFVAGFVWRGLAPRVADGFALHLVANGGLLLLGAGLLAAPRLLCPGRDLLGAAPGGLPRGAVLGLLAYAAVLLPVLWLHDLNQEWVLPPEDRERVHPTVAFVLGLKGDSARLAVMFVLVAVVVPLFEEALFRGWLQSGIRVLVGRVVGPRSASAVAVVGAGAVFTVIHAPFMWVPVMGMGLLLGGLYERTRNLWVAVALHGSHNACTLALALTSP